VRAVIVTSVSTLNGQWLDIFRAGSYGDKGTFTVPQLSALAASYDPAKQEAPIVVGHPKLDAPAFGWVKQLRMQGDVLQGLLGDVDPDFDEAVQAKRYKKRSVAFVRNSSTGVLKLRHVGWLGAMPPHVEGLRDAQFNAEEYDEIDFSEGEEMDEQQVKKTVTQAITEFFANLGGKKTENDSGLTQVEIDAAIAKATSTIESRFADQLKAEKDARVALETQLADQKKTFSDSSATTRVAALIGGLKASKRWIPAYDKMGVPALFASLATGASTEIEFGEGDAKKKVDSIQLFADILNGIGQIVPDGVTFSEKSGETRTPKTPDGNGAAIDTSSVSFNEQVEAYAKENKVEFVDAYRELVRQGKRPESGSSSAGAV
jgi:hypothetical protein